MAFTYGPLWTRLIEQCRERGLSPHCHEGCEYYVRDGKGVRKVGGEVGLYGFSEGGPFHEVEKQVVFAVSPFATRTEVIRALYSLAAYISRLPDSDFGADVSDISGVTTASQAPRGRSF